MNRLLTGVVLITLFAVPILSQQAWGLNCTSADILLSTQSDVDNFQATYGDGETCDTVTGNLTIGGSGSNIGDLTPLSDLVSVYRLTIHRTPLTNLNGLSALTTTGDSLDISNNGSLTSLNGLSSLTTVNGSFVIMNNASLGTLSGLSALVSVGQNPAEEFQNSFQISDNDSLTSLDGLTNLTTVEWLTILNNPILTAITRPPSMTSIKNLSVENNQSLVDLNGLAGLANVEGSFLVFNNNSLANLDGLTSLTSIGGEFQLYQNGALANIDDLSNLASIGTLMIMDNDSLTNLDGLSGLEPTPRIYVTRNDNLTNIDGLSNLTGALSVTFKDNVSLAQVNGLSGLVSVIETFSLHDNASLATCGALTTLLDNIDDGEPGPGPGIDGIPDVGGDIRIENNLPGCNSIDEIWPRTFTIGGFVNGLYGSGLVLQNNATDNLRIETNGSFIFTNELEVGATYSVTVRAQPENPGQYCSVENGSGTLGVADITDVAVTCIDFCNVNMVSGVTEYSGFAYEACEILGLGPGFIAADGSDVSANSGWEIVFLPGFIVEQGATFTANVCGQSLCLISESPMPYGCHSCVDQICEVDSYCCDTDFDQICVDEVDTVCGLACE